jgi:LmbE family N-acetylglucosaminyl deacetylase
VIASAPTCLIFSPHPDDEALVGGLALRLRRVHGWRVVNIAVTLGSRLDRRADRWKEAEASCAHLGFELESSVGQPGRALERITPQAARNEPAHWQQAVLQARALIERWRPRVIQAPHALDGHAAHIGTHCLVRDALRQCGSALQAHLCWSEYWNTQLTPGLMVELDDTDVIRMMAATALHVGEIRRHPYHLSLPAWLIDSARRGFERVAAPGSPAQAITYAALYGWQFWDGRRFRRPASRVVTAQADLAACLG